MYKVKKETEAWYVHAEFCIMEPGFGGTTSPQLRIDPVILSEQVEDEFVHKVEKMLRNAFDAARQQWANKQ